MNREAKWSDETRDLIHRATRPKIEDQRDLRIDLMMQLVRIETKLAFLFHHARHLPGMPACTHGCADTTWCQLCFQKWVTS